MLRVKVKKYRRKWTFPWKRKKTRWCDGKIRELNQFILKHIASSLPCNVTMTPDLAALLDTLNPPGVLRREVIGPGDSKYELYITGTTVPVTLDMLTLAPGSEMHAIIRPVVRDEITILRCGRPQDIIGTVIGDVWESNG